VSVAASIVSLDELKMRVEKIKRPTVLRAKIIGTKQHDQ